MAEHTYCENCRFFRPDTFHKGVEALKYGRCGNPAAQEPPSLDRFISDKLDTPPDHKYAGIFREYGACGRDAKLFEPREPEQVAA